MLWLLSLLFRRHLCFQGSTIFNRIFSYTIQHLDIPLPLHSQSFTRKDWFLIDKSIVKKLVFLSYFCIIETSLCYFDFGLKGQDFHINRPGPVDMLTLFLYLECTEIRKLNECIDTFILYIFLANTSFVLSTYRLNITRLDIGRSPLILIKG